MTMEMTTIKLHEEQMTWLNHHDGVNLSGLTRDALDLVRNGKLSYVNGNLTLTPDDPSELEALLGIDDLTTWAEADHCETCCGNCAAEPLTETNQ